MTNIGQKLKDARTALGYSISQVAAETNISPRYIQALEEEQFDIFPGDTYVIGFLKNYADYLGLDAQSIVNTFRGLRIQEQDVPVEQLLNDKTTKNTSSLIYWGVGGALGLVLIATLLFAIIGKKNNTTAQEPVHTPVVYTLETKTFEKRLYVGDSLTVIYNNEKYAIALKQIDDTVLFQTPTGTRNFLLGEEGSIDLDKDNIPELYVFISDFQKNAPSVGALVRFSAADTLALASKATNETTEPNPVTVVSTPVPAKSSEKNGAFITAVFTGKRSPFPFTANITFRNYAMFRFEVDRKTREEKYFRKGDIITINATNSMIIWCSNAGAPKISIIASGGQNADIEMGNPGEVSVRALRWTQADDGTWTLGLYQLD